LCVVVCCCVLLCVVVCCCVLSCLLHEMHHIGKATPCMLYGTVPSMIFGAVMQVGGILTAAGDSADDNVEVPIWAFAVVLLSLIMMLAYVSAYGNLTLAIERDVDQDVSRPSELCGCPLCPRRVCVLVANNPDADRGD